MTSEHKQQIRFSTVVVVVVVGVMSLTFAAMVGVATYGFVTGQAFTLSGWLVAMTMGVFLSGINGIAFVRFFRRMLSVREVRLFEDDTIEIVTRRGRKFMARLPENIKHMLVMGTNYSVTFQVEDRWFVVDTEQLSGRDRINDYFRRFVERCSTKFGERENKP